MSAPLSLLLVSLLSIGAASAQNATSTAAATASSGSTPAVTADPGLPQSAPASLMPSSYSVPDLTAITASMATQSTIGLDTSYTVGASPTISGAPALPTYPAAANYPSLDVTPPTDSDQVKAWLAELDLSDVPDLNQTTGACADSPEAAADKSRCWWTCGGCVRSTDITNCPNKYDWGLSYDDGPSPYTPILLDFLNEHDITTTFFVVGSRVISRPEMLQAEYMAGHQISVHTWSHPYLTSLTNEQIVAELGWTKKVIKDVLGVTPNTMRPPYGDIDDRVRAIAAKMGLTPIIWTSSKDGETFDTTDWNIPGGGATGASSLAKFETILQSAADIDTGFIVLEHDLYQQTVDLAVGYFLPMAIKSINASSPYSLMSISDCLGQDRGESYIETASNNTVYSFSVSASGTAYPVSQGTGSATAGSSTIGASVGSGGGSTASASASGSSSSSSSDQASGAESLVFSHGVKGLLTLGLVAVGAGLAL